MLSDCGVFHVELYAFSMWNFLLEGSFLHLNNLANEAVNYGEAPSSFQLTLQNVLNYNPQPTWSPSLPPSGTAFPILPHNANYVITNTTGLTRLTLDGISVSITTGTIIYVAANHKLIPTYTGSPKFEILPI